jgi:uncharacterized integral membrane protein
MENPLPDRSIENWDPHERFQDLMGAIIVFPGEIDCGRRSGIAECEMCYEGYRVEVMLPTAAIDTRLITDHLTYQVSHCDGSYYNECLIRYSSCLVCIQVVVLMVARIFLILNAAQVLGITNTDNIPFSFFCLPFAFPILVFYNLIPTYHIDAQIQSSLLAVLLFIVYRDRKCGGGAVALHLPV